MKKIIGVLSQKGGVGKSTIARLIGVEYARMNHKVLIADMDNSQSTCYEWNLQRGNTNIEPIIDARKYDEVNQAISDSKNHDILIFDGAPHATRVTKQIAEVSNLILLPTGSSLEDLKPQIRLAHGLISSDIPKDKIAFILSKINSSDSELEDVRDYISNSGYHIFKEFIPEKIAFRQAIAEGKMITETKYNTLNQRCLELFNSISKKIEKL